MQLVVGRVGRPHGLRGEVTVEVRTDDPDQRFMAGSSLATVPAARGPLKVASSRWHSGRLLVRFAGYEDRNAAEELRDTILAIDSDELEPLEDPDDFYDHDLIGLQVVTAVGDSVGAVSDGTGTRSGAEILVPFVAAIVPEVDVAAGRLVIDPPPGLLDPDAAV